MERYIFQKSSTLPNGWVLTDTLNGVVVTFEDGRFNETQKVTMLEDKPLSKHSVADLARIMREIGAWAVKYHSSKCFSQPYGFEYDRNEKMYLYRRKSPKWRLFVDTDDANMDAKLLAASLKKAAEWLTKGRSDENGE